MLALQTHHQGCETSLSPVSYHPENLDMHKQETKILEEQICFWGYAKML